MPVPPDRLAARCAELERELEATRAALARRDRLLTAIADVERAIARRLPLDDVLDRIVETLGDLLANDVPGLLLVDPADPAMLIVRASRNVPGEVLAASARRPLGQGVGGRAVVEGRLVVENDYPAYENRVPAFDDMALQAAMAAPVLDGRRIVGSLVVSRTAVGRPFTAEEQELLRAFADHASLALADARTAAAVAHQALHDALTGLPNRTLLRDRAERALAAARRRGTHVALLFLDLDRFKTVNDSLGHAAGDELLVEVARRIDGCMRGGDTAARLGGDEFAVLLEDLEDPRDAEQVAARIVEELGRPVRLRGRDVVPSVSIGVTTGAGPADQLLQRADLAMYRAKELGRGRHETFEPEMLETAVARLELEADLRRAVARGEIGIHLQPVVELEGGLVRGVEALARWDHPRRGLLLPDAFIPLAEELGLVGQLGAQVLDRACEAAVALRAAHPELDLHVGVNVSGRQVGGRELAAQVRDALARTGLPPRVLGLEVTETALVRDLDAAAEQLAELRLLGVKIVIDDFGTGYSSLRHVRRFPLDGLKMAKPFVDGLAGAPDGEEDGEAVARAIVELARSLGAWCVAEGIEHPEQVERLVGLGCAHGQGFLLAHPMAPDLLRDWLTAHRGRAPAAARPPAAG